jgi:hypothetical protein
MGRICISFPNPNHLVKLFLSLLILLPALSRSEDIYQIRKLSERELLQTYTSIMMDACHHSDKFWTNSTFDSQAGHWGSGRSDQMNEGIRSVSGMVLTCGALLKYSNALSEADRREFFRKTQAAIRFATTTHLTGTQKCPDGKPWGGSWQSAMWTATMGFGAWLIWDDLDSSLRKDLERVVSSEANRFLKIKPPGGNSSDTKAEENGWNLVCIALAANMFPNHSNATAWNEKSSEYAMNTLSAPQDAQDKKIVDGRPASEWFAGANIHEDFALENHGFFHPAYQACSSYFLTETAMFYMYAGRPIPQAATHHLLDSWRVFQEIILPWGASAYPQGMDWELHGLPFVNLYASLASYQKDAFAARMENRAVQYIRAWQLTQDGDLAISGSRLGFTRHTCTIDQVTFAFLAHKIFGEPVKEMSARKAAELVKGVRTHDAVKFITDRTDDKFVSFSWKNKIMGMLIPIGEGHEGNPNFTVPIRNGFVGSFELSPKTDAKVTVVEQTWKKIPKGFETSGTLLMNGGKLRQALRLTSVGEKAVVYQDRVVALTNVSVAELGIPIGIENDQITGGTRTVSFQNGEAIFDWQKPKTPTVISGSWANVSGRLGVVVVNGSGMNYTQASGYAPGISVYTDILYASFSNQPKQFKAGEEVAHRISIFFVEVSPKETAKLAKSFKVENKSGGKVLRFKLPEGGEAEVPLL